VDRGLQEIGDQHASKRGGLAVEALLQRRRTSFRLWPTSRVSGSASQRVRLPSTASRRPGGGNRRSRPSEIASAAGAGAARREAERALRRQDRDVEVPAHPGAVSSQASAVVTSSAGGTSLDRSRSGLVLELVDQGEELQPRCRAGAGPAGRVARGAGPRGRSGTGRLVPYPFRLLPRLKSPTGEDRSQCCLWHRTGPSLRSDEA